MSEALSKKETLKARAASAQVRFPVNDMLLKLQMRCEAGSMQTKIGAIKYGWNAGKHRCLLRMRIMSWLTALQGAASALAQTST